MPHHKDCDGWRMHSVRAERDHWGTFIPWCDSCEAPVPNVIGSAGSKGTAVSMGRHHNASVECAGECAQWAS